jgi:hypothetical protein
MANPTQDRPQRRVRGPNIETVIAAAAKTGRHLVGAATKPGGVVELTFAAAAETAATVGEQE